MSCIVRRRCELRLNVCLVASWHPHLRFFTSDFPYFYSLLRFDFPHGHHQLQLKWFYFHFILGCSLANTAAVLFPNPAVRAGRHHSDTLPHCRDTGKGHECIPFVTASSAVVQIQVLTVLCIFLSPSLPFLSSLSPPPPDALFISSGYLFLHSTPSRSLCHCLLSATLPSSFFPSLWPPPFLHRSVVLFLSFPLATAAGPAPFPACCPGAAHGPSPLRPASPGTGSGRRLWAAGPVRGSWGPAGL